MLVYFLFLCPFIIAQIMVLWFESEFVVEYARLLKLNNSVSFFKRFDKQEREGSPLNFKEFLTQNYNSFFIRLITCPICLSAWLGFIGSIIVGFSNWKIGLIVSLPFAYLGLFLYEIVRKLIRL
jgi:hypothetical protein